MGELTEFSIGLLVFVLVLVLVFVLVFVLVLVLDLGQCWNSSSFIKAILVMRHLAKGVRVTAGE